MKYWKILFNKEYSVGVIHLGLWEARDTINQVLIANLSIIGFPDKFIRFTNSFWKVH